MGFHAPEYKLNSRNMLAYFSRLVNVKFLAHASLQLLRHALKKPATLAGGRPSRKKITCGTQ